MIRISPLVKMSDTELFNEVESEYSSEEEVLTYEQFRTAINSGRSFNRVVLQTSDSSSDNKRPVSLNRHKKTKRSVCRKENRPNEVKVRVIAFFVVVE